MFHININRMAIVALALAVIAPRLASPDANAASPTGAHLEKPYKLEAIPGSEIKRIVLTEKAARRIDVKTGQISKDASGKLVAPYLAIMFDLKGETWVYTNPGPLQFVRHKVTVETVKGEKAFLTDGPPDETRVVTQGVAELYGTERGIGH